MQWRPDCCSCMSFSAKNAPMMELFIRIKLDESFGEFAPCSDFK
jgi:hypothetical protein